jgi:glutamate decarboxylase
MSCCRYVPPSLRPFDRTTASAEHWAALGRVAPAIKARMQHAGDALIGYQPLGPLPNFFRMVFANCVGVSKQQLQQVLQRIDEYGHDL